RFDIGAEKLVAGEKGLQEFEFVLADSSVVQAAARIDGKHVILPLQQGQVVKAVRYAWKNGSGASLFNSAGLPASTFSILVK
ncbi:MAG: sialate O-acetylesterase, partial [Calditrichaeota bacterium]